MYQPSIQQNYQQPQVQRKSFFLKWIAGTTVSKRYGCCEKIQNPLKLAPDDLVMTCKDIRLFRDAVTGVLRYSDAPQNVHFHLRSVCVRTRYPNFNYTCLDVSLQMQQSLSPLQFQRLLSEFYWRQWNPYQLFLELLLRLGFFCLLSFHDHFYFSVKFFAFWDVFDVSCIIILGNWFAKFLLVRVSLNDMFKGKLTNG